MSEFAPPTGPPPPKVPEGWKAIWNDQYNEYFYVNIYTKKSQWNKPEAPVYPPGERPLTPDEAPAGAPPAYDESEGKATGPDKHRSEKAPLSTDPTHAAGESSSLTEDEKLARQLQDEENARAGVPPGSDKSRAGAADNYYNDPYAQMPPGYGGGQAGGAPGGPSVSPQPQKRGVLGKLFGKNKQQQQQPQYPPPQQAYGQPPYGQQPPYGYGQPHPQAGYYGAPQQGYGRRPGGMGSMLPAAALGVGGGLLGGALLGSALDGHDGGDDGGDFGGDGGGDFGGGGGDFGGGDFGGGGF